MSFDTSDSSKITTGMSGSVGIPFFQMGLVPARLTWWEILNLPWLHALKIIYQRIAAIVTTA
jgi:hypothetical protein